jgi:hypothetical protein
MLKARSRSLPWLLRWLNPASIQIGSKVAVGDSDTPADPVARQVS